MENKKDRIEKVNFYQKEISNIFGFLKNDEFKHKKNIVSFIFLNFTFPFIIIIITVTIIHYLLPTNIQYFFRFSF